MCCILLLEWVGKIVPKICTTTENVVGQISVSDVIRHDAYLDNQVRSVGFAPEANSSDDRLIRTAVGFAGKAHAMACKKQKWCAIIAHRRFLTFSDDPKP